MVSGAHDILLATAASAHLSGTVCTIPLVYPSCTYYFISATTPSLDNSMFIDVLADKHFVSY